MFYQLGIIAEIMNSFLINVSISSEIINKHCLKHELSENDCEIIMNTVQGIKEKDVQRVLTVQRGIPSWLQELEGNTNAITKRVPKSLAEFVTQDKNSN